MAEWLEKIVEALREGATVLTVNRRLSKHIQSAYNSSEQGAGKSVWETPVVLPVGAWSERLWREACSSSTEKPVSLISEARSRALWMSIVESGCTASARSVLSAQGVAETSYSAYKLMAEYCVTIDGLGPELYLSVESRAFKGWVGAYTGKLAALGFIDKSMLKSRVVGVIKECGAIGGVLPDSLFLVGFETLTPSARLLMSTLKSAGVKVENVGADKMTLSSEEISHKDGAHKEGASDQIIVRQYADEVAEVRAGARWVRARLAENQEGNGGSIGVVVPDLQRYRATLLAEFSAELDPKSILPSEAPSGVFNISLGAPLADAPLVRSALALLSIHTPGDTVESLSSVLFSPAFSYDRETYAAAALLDAELKRDRVGALSLVGLKRAVESRTPKGGVLAGAVKKLDCWIETLREIDIRQLPGYWADKFATLLDALGWPVGGTVLSSAEYQLVEAWRSLLGDFAAFDDTHGPVSRREACGHLKRLAAGAIHQVESPDSPVQVLGLFEAAGFTFDSLLLLGADSTALPASRTPNPFIPLEVQKELGFQDSTPERVHRFAAAVAARVLKSGVKVEASYARTFGGVEQSVSPLLPVDECTFVDVEEKAVKRPAEGSSIKERLHAAGGASVLEELPDEERVALTEVERANLRGGTSIIKDQSACPFKAFATHRLGARGISVVEPGFDSMDRGNTVHEALKHFWREVKDSATLAAAASDGSISALVSGAVAKAMDDKGRELPARYLQLEAERVEALLAEWLELELKRESFTVKATECSEEITIGGLKLKTRLDRIDTLRSGGELIIDYKTGECKREYWNPERPKEPQLLLYNLVGSFDAIAFARVKLKGTKFVGVMKETVELPGVKPVGVDGWTEKIEGVENWADLEARWKETLEAIAEEFADGVACVAPDSTLKGNDHPCEFCDLTLLCRRYELNVGPGRRQ